MPPSEQQNLVDLRKKRNLSQQDLGLRVAKELKIKWTEAVAQKRISNWEAGASLPSGSEHRALAKVLGISAHDLDLAIQRQKVSEGQISFERLAAAEAAPSFVGICFTSEPAGHHDPTILAAMQKGIASGKISFAMFVPGRETDALTVDSKDPEVAKQCATLNFYANDVWLEVHRYYKAIRDGVEDHNPAEGSVLKDHLRMYQPTNKTIPFTPSGSRYCLVIQAQSEGKGTAYEKKLYLWVHTARLNDLQLVGTSEDGGSQVKAWEAYYTGILTEWFKEGRKLPEQGGFWTAVQGEESV